jgi:hypothetical protein
MKQKHADYKMVPYPKIRRLMATEFRSFHHTPMIHGLIAVDVSKARAHLREYKAKTGESLSFTAFLMACLAKAVDEHKAVQAMRKGLKHLILFEEVDALTYIERGVAPMPYIIRAANHKTVREIHQEIRATQVQDVAQAWEEFKVLHWPWLLLLPAFLVMLWMGKRSPQAWKKYRGDGGHHNSGDVWERGWMGNSSRLPFPLDDGGRHWREAGGR